MSELLASAMAALQLAFPVYCADGMAWDKGYGGSAPPGLVAFYQARQVGGPAVYLRRSACRRMPCDELVYVLTHELRHAGQDLTRDPVFYDLRGREADANRWADRFAPVFAARICRRGK